MSDDEDGEADGAETHTPRKLQLPGPIKTYPQQSYLFTQSGKTAMFSTLDLERGLEKKKMQRGLIHCKI